MLTPNARERVGYPTQKPLVLLERIIQASSNHGDVVLDPFCGCATACIAAEKHGREWMGIDLSEKAAELVLVRADREIGGLFRLTHRKAPDFPKRTDQGKLPPYRTHKLATLFVIASCSPAMPAGKTAEAWGFDFRIDPTAEVRERLGWNYIWAIRFAAQRWEQIVYSGHEAKGFVDMSKAKPFALEYSGHEIEVWRPQTYIGWTDILVVVVIDDEIQEAGPATATRSDTPLRLFSPTPTATNIPSFIFPFRIMSSIT